MALTENNLPVRKHTTLIMFSSWFMEWHCEEVIHFIDIVFQIEGLYITFVIWSEYPYDPTSLLTENKKIAEVKSSLLSSSELPFLHGESWQNNKIELNKNGKYI